MKIMGQSLGLRLARHSMTTSNLANMDTPGYKVRDLSFEGAMQQAMTPPEGRLQPRATHAEHMPVRNVERAYQAAQNSVKYHVYGKDEEGKDIVDIDQEMTKLSKNHLLYNATVQMLAKEFELLKHSITEGGR
jgi:flagellar basal-body rod protein FlgB